MVLAGSRDRPGAQRQLIVKNRHRADRLASPRTMGHLFRTTVRLSIIMAITSRIMPPMHSFPSDHGTVIFTLRWRFVLAPPWSGIVMMAIAITIARRAVWSRRTLAVIDMIGALLVAMRWLPERATDSVRYGAPLYRALQRCYRFCFALPILKRLGTRIK